MIRYLVILTAFFNAQVYTVPAIAQEAVQKSFKNSIQQLQNQVDFENFEKTTSAQKEVLDTKKLQIQKSIQADIVMLRARLNELGYLTDFLKIDDSARNAVTQSLKVAEKDSTHAAALVATSAVIALISGGTYVFAKNKTPEATTEAPTKTTRARAQAKANIFTRAFEAVRTDSQVRNAAGVVFVASVITGAAVLVSSYYSNYTEKEAAANQTDIFLSRLASENQQDYLTHAQVNQLFTEKSKDANFHTAIANELNVILKESDQRTAAIYQKRLDLANLVQQISSLDEQVAQKRALLRQAAK